MSLVVRGVSGKYIARTEVESYWRERVVLVDIVGADEEGSC